MSNEESLLEDILELRTTFTHRAVDNKTKIRYILKYFECKITWEDIYLSQLEETKP